MLRRVALAVAAALVLLPASATAATTDVSIGDDFFDPAATKVAQGDTVRWTNHGGSMHTTTGKVGLWDATLDEGQSFARLFPQAGSFGYLCRFHDEMTGTVRVPVKVSPASGSTTTVFTVTLGTSSAPSGFQYVVQKRKGTGAWSTYRITTASSVTFDPATNGTYSFRSKLQRISDGASSGYSPAKKVVVG